MKMETDQHTLGCKSIIIRIKKLSLTQYKNVHTDVSSRSPSVLRGDLTRVQHAH